MSTNLKIDGKKKFRKPEVNKAMRRMNITQILSLIFVLLNVLTDATDVAVADECMVCYEHFPVSFQFSCGHELCSLCAESMLKFCDNTNCPKCRGDIPRHFTAWLLMVKIYPTQLTPDISLEKLQRVFPLICSVAKLTTVIHCVNMGVNVNTQGCFGFFPIQLASEANVAQYLLIKGADVNQLSNNGVSPLFMSSQMGYLRLVKYFIKKGAEVNQVNNEGMTPLFSGHLLVVTYLIKVGADVNQRTSFGITPLLNACFHEGQLPVIKFLTENGANVNQADIEGVTPLFASSYKGDLEVVKYLVENGANINQTNFIESETPLFISSQRGYLSIVQYLIQSGADVNQATENGMTPLAVAIDNNHKEVAKYLVNNGANIEITVLYFKKNTIFKLFEFLDNICNEMEEQSYE